MKRIMAAIAAGVALCISGFAQSSQSGNAQSSQNYEPATPAAFVSVSAIGTFAGEFGYNSPGAGAVIAVGIPLPRNLYLTEDLWIVREHKTGFERGRTVAALTGLQYHLPSGVSLRAKLQITNHTNELYTKWATRANLGAGWARLSKSSALPLIELESLAQLPLSDQNKSWGLKTSIGGFYEFPHNAFGVKGKLTGAVMNARDSFTPRRGWARYGSVEFGVFVNLSAIAGN